MNNNSLESSLESFKSSKESESDSDSDNIYYSPTNIESNSEVVITKINNLFTCYCNENNSSCLILCFNQETEQFENINCNEFKLFI